MSLLPNNRPRQLVNDALAADEQISFNAGTHTELIQPAYKDFERLVKPNVVAFTT